MKKLLALCVILVNFGAVSAEEIVPTCEIVDVSGVVMKGLTINCQDKRVAVQFTDQDTGLVIALEGGLYGGTVLSVQFDDYYWLSVSNYELAEIPELSCNAEGFANAIRERYVSYDIRKDDVEVKQALSINPDAEFIHDISSYYYQNPAFVKSGYKYETLLLGDTFSEVSGCSKVGNSYHYSDNNSGTFLKVKQNLYSNSITSKYLYDATLAGTKTYRMH